MAGMARLTFDALGRSRQILLLGGHCDDIEIGCGATLVDLIKRSPDIEFHVIIFCSDSRREQETRHSLKVLLGEDADITFNFGGLRDGYLPYQAVAAKDFLLSKVKALTPDLVFTHNRDDLHQDHRFVGEITYQALRDSLILEMEIPKYDGDTGRPNVYFPVSQAAADHKVSTLMECYASQLDKHWFTKETFMAILRLRGLECRSAGGMAEAFYASKIVIS